jgi:hypothetical protein
MAGERDSIKDLKRRVLLAPLTLRASDEGGPLQQYRLRITPPLTLPPLHDTFSHRHTHPHTLRGS